MQHDPPFQTPRPGDVTPPPGAENDRVQAADRPDAVQPASDDTATHLAEDIAEPERAQTFRRPATTPGLGPGAISPD